jgi:hypothetical protein
MSTLAPLAAIAFALHFAWEVLQTPAFGPMGPTWVDGLLICVRATLADVIIVAGLFGLGAWLFRDGRWFEPARPLRYALVTVVAIAIQIIVERIALAEGRWTYQQWHPTLFGAGLFPILQGAVLTPVIFGLLGWWQRRRPAT